jgi:hypothetical protein
MTDDDGEGGLDAHGDPRVRPEEQWEREQRTIDYSPSSGPKGAGKRIYDATAPRAHDGRAKTNTKFHAKESDGGHPDYWRLAKINDGLYSDDDDKRRGKMERRRDVETFTGIVEFSDRQVKRVLALLERAEAQGSCDIYQSNEVLILALLTIVANRDNQMIRQDERFKELLETCNVKRSELRKGRQKLRETIL